MTRPDVLPSAKCTASAPRIGIFRGSMAGLCAPLSTLRRNPRGQLRMTGVDVDRYSFIVRDLHSLLLAGLPALRKCFPLYPRKRTQVGHRAMSEKCQKRKQCPIANIGGFAKPRWHKRAPR